MALARLLAVPVATLMCQAARPLADTEVHFVSALVVVLLEMQAKLLCRLDNRSGAQVVL